MTTDMNRERFNSPLNDVPRPEYPRPQFVREGWMNLNGPWDFLFDFGKSGMDPLRAAAGSRPSSPPMRRSTMAGTWI